MGSLGMDRLKAGQWRGPLLFALFVLLWLLHHPYEGIRHDAVLYALQALKHLHPEHFARDVYFLFGSQDDYTLYSFFYAGLAQGTGLGQAALLLTLTGAMAWCFAAWRLSSIWQGGVRWLFLFLLAVMPIKYGGSEIFEVAEPFAVPRLWANALTLLACALWLQQRRWLALACWLAGMAMHPIMALAGAMLVFFYELRFTRQWAWGVLAGALAACALALFEAPMFGRLLQAMDAQWFDLLHKRTSYFLFPSEWVARNYNTLGFHAAALLWAAWLAGETWQRRLFLAACATGLAGWLVALVFGDWLHSVLVLQMQTWRTLWLMYVFGWAAVAIVSVQLWRPARFVVLGLWAAWFLRDYSGSLILLLVALLYWQRAHMGRVAERVLEAALAAAVALGLVWVAVGASTAYLAVLPGSELNAARTVFVWRDALNAGESALTLAIALLVWLAWQWKRPAALGLLLAGVLFLGYGRSWDARSPQLKLLEGGSLWQQTPFNRHIPVDATVYWLGGWEQTWLLLGRSSYFSRQQSAGLIFSRPLAMEIYRRYQNVYPLAGSLARMKFPTREEMLRRQTDALSDIVPGTLPALRRACADPGLDYVILDKRHEPHALAAWHAPFFSGGVYLYACETLRKN